LGFDAKRVQGMEVPHCPRNRIETQKLKNWEETNRIQTYKVCTFLEVDNFLP
jgi:hypothetical protein